MTAQNNEVLDATVPDPNEAPPGLDQPTSKAFDILPSMKEGDSLVAINVLIAEHCMLCYPTCSRRVSRRAVARTGNRCAALNVPARNRETWQVSI
jgi:hypothetical protein